MKFFSDRAKSLLAITAIILLAGAVGLAQDTSKPAQSIPSPPLMRVNVLVLDNKGKPVTDLSQNDFQVFENDEPQTLSFFSKEDIPVSYGLLIDSSGSLRTQFKGIIEAAKAIVNSNNSADETFVVRFIGTDIIELVQDLTADKKKLFDALDILKVAGGQTAVIDAIYISADHIANHRPEVDATPRRHALVVVTDGEERGSKRYSEDELIKLLRKINVQVFVIGLTSELDKEGGLIRRSPRERAVTLIEKLGKEAGGVGFFPKSASELQTVAGDITRYLHMQYVVGYNPNVKASKDSYHKLRIKLIDAPGREKYRVIVRPGYTAPQPER